VRWKDDGIACAWPRRNSLISRRAGVALDNDNNGNNDDNAIETWIGKLSPMSGFLFLRQPSFFFPSSVKRT